MCGPRLNGRRRQIPTDGWIPRPRGVSIGSLAQSATQPRCAFRLLAINQANATINVTLYSVSYDAAAHTATGTATGVGSANLSAGLNLTGTTHTSAGDASPKARQN